MMAIQSAINRLIGTAGAATALAGKFNKKQQINVSTSEKDSGVDAQMAKRARMIAQQKIKTIQANKEISDQAKTRRIGKVLDEFKGGNK